MVDESYRFDPLRFVYVGLCESYVCSVQIQSLCHMEKMEQTIAVLDSATLEKYGENTNSRRIHTITVNGGHNYQQYISITLFEYIYHITP